MANEAEPLELTTEELAEVRARRAARVAEAEAAKVAAAEAESAADRAKEAEAKAKAAAERRAKELARSDASLSAQLAKLADRLVEAVGNVCATIESAQRATVANASPERPRDMTEFAGHLAAALAERNLRLPTNNIWTLKHAVDLRPTAVSVSDESGARMARQVADLIFDAIIAAERGPDPGLLEQAADVFVKHRTEGGAKQEIDALTRSQDQARHARDMAAHQERLGRSQPSPPAVGRTLPKPSGPRDVLLHEGETFIGDELPRVG